MIFNFHISYCLEDKTKRHRKISCKGTEAQFAKILFKTSIPRQHGQYQLGYSNTGADG